MTKIEALSTWLQKLNRGPIGQMLSPTLFASEHESVETLPPHKEVQYVDGTRKITKFYAFRVKKVAQTANERQAIRTFIDTLEARIRDKCRKGDLPLLDEGLEPIWVRVVQGPFFVAWDGEFAIHKVEIAMTYVEEF